MMTNTELTAVFADINDRIFRKKLRTINAEFYKYRQIKHTIQWTPFKIRIRVSDYLINAPLSILESLAVILLSRIYKKKIDKRIKIRYHAYIDSIEDKIIHKKFNRIDRYRAKGNRYDLNVLFSQLNARYFNKELIHPQLGWSRNNSYRRLGFYDQNRNLLVISRIFDNQKVPEEIVKYLLYHEMLHIKYPSTQKNGRRVIHSPAFRKEEKRYPSFNTINRWLKSNLKHL